MGQIEGQVALTTGADSEIAQGIAKRFAREGAFVVLVESQSGEAEAVVRGIRQAGGFAEARVAELGKDGAASQLADAVAKAHGGIDILVNAAHAALVWSPMDKKPLTDFTSAYHRVVLPAVAAMQAVRPYMVARGGGRIVNVGSIYGSSANEGVVDAIAMDGALAALTRAAGVEWARDGILVNYLQAALPNIGAFTKYREERGVIVDHLIRNMPMPRLADPVEDIGGAAMFLVSDEACFIAGHKIFADGGQHMVAAVFEPGAHR